MLPKAFPSWSSMQRKAIMPPRARSRSFIALTCTLFLIAFSLLSISIYSREPQEQPKVQERRRPTKPALESQIPQESPDRPKGYTIGVNVDLVLMYISVFDKSGRFIGDL